MNANNIATLQQGDDSVTAIFMRKEKALSDELVDTNRPVSPETSIYTCFVIFLMSSFNP